MFPLRKPKPDIEWFRKVLLGEIIPDRPPFAELSIDNEIRKTVIVNELGREWIDKGIDFDSRKKYWDNYIEFNYRMGYDYICLSGVGIPFESKGRMTEDTAAGIMKKQARGWVEEGTGVIASWGRIRKIQLAKYT